jgi:hypothetical protein
MKIKIDSRSKDYSYARHFGSVAGFDPEYIVDRNDIVDPIQPVGDVRCSCYTTCDIAGDKEDIYYDISDLANRVPLGKDGADPKAVIKETITNGLLPMGGNLRFKPFSSYFQAHTGPYDAFDNMRSALSMAKYPVAIWGAFYQEWLGGILEKGKTIGSYHEFECEGWKVIDGITYLQFEAWTGRKYYMNREVFNWYAKQWATDTAVLSDEEVDARRRKTLMETIIDLCKNTIVLLNQLIAQQLPDKKNIT